MWGALCLLLMGCLVEAQTKPWVKNEQLNTIWEIFKKQHDKVYSSKDDDEFRRYTWEENVDFIQKHNMEYDLGLHTFSVGLNYFADWTTEEFRKHIACFQNSNMTKYAAFENMHKPRGVELPTSVDWRTKGYVTPVKDQKQCGSCWAFSATGALEGQHYRKTGQLVSLSEQNLVDCSTTYGNHGCGGGLMTLAYKYIMENGGIDTEQCYPYEAKDLTCRFKPNCIGAVCRGYRLVQKGSESALQDAVANQGPVAVAIDAGQQSFMLYKSGLYYEPKCTHKLNHGVLAVGYGEEQDGQYWIVKNSWSRNWGDGGYIKMARNRQNNCGIADDAVYPLV